MNWKRKLEVICGLITAVLGITLMLLFLRLDHLATQRVGETWQMGKETALFFALYALPGLLVGFGAYSHAGRTRPSWRLVLITASLFLTVWFFLSLVLVVWSGLFIPAALLTGFAIVTSVISLVIRTTGRNFGHDCIEED